MTTLNTHDPPGLCGSTSTRVSAAALRPRGDVVSVDLPRAWCARSVSSFCVALFCKTSGSTRTVQSQKKKSSRGWASRYASREKWPSLLNARRATATGDGGVLDDAPPLSVGAAASAAPIGRRRPTWRQRGQPARPQPLFTRFPLDRYFCGSRTTTTTCTLCATRERRDSRSRFENKAGAGARRRARATPRYLLITGSVVTDVGFKRLPSAPRPK